MMQRIFAVVAFVPTNRRWFSVVLVHGEASLYRFELTLLLFCLNLHGPESLKKEFAFLQYFDGTCLFDETNKELNCVCLRFAMDKDLDHSANFNIANPEPIEAGKWYGLVPYPSILSVHLIVRSNYFVLPFSPQLPWPASRYYVNCFHQCNQ